MGNIGGTAGRYTYTSYSTPISTDSSTDDSTGSSSEYSTEGSTDGSMMDSTVFEAEDTIAAIATAVSGQSGGIAIVRMSGPEALSIASRVFVPVRNRARAANGTATRSKSNSTIEREEEEGEGEWVGRSENGGARSAWESHKAVYGHVMDHEKGLIVDEVSQNPLGEGSENISGNYSKSPVREYSRNPAAEYVEPHQQVAPQGSTSTKM